MNPKIQKYYLLALLIISTVTIMCGPAFGSVIKNGSFADGDTGWRCTGNTFFGSSATVNGVRFEAEDGNMAGINVPANGYIWENSISQEFVFSPEIKHLTFKYNFWTTDASSQDGLPSFSLLLNNAVVLATNTVLVAPEQVENDLHYTGWQHCTIDVSDYAQLSGIVTAFSISFNAGDSGNGLGSGIFLDDIAMAAPVPPAFILMGSGFIGLAAVRIRQRHGKNRR